MRDVDHWLQERISLLERLNIANEEYIRERMRWQNICDVMHLPEDLEVPLHELQKKYEEMSRLLDQMLALSHEISQCHRVDRLAIPQPNRMWADQIINIQRMQYDLGEEIRKLESGASIWRSFEDMKRILEEIERLVEENWKEIPGMFEGRLHLADGPEVLEQFRIQYMMEQEEDWDESNPSSNTALAQSIRYGAKLRYLGIQLPKPKSWDAESSFRAMENLDFHVQWSSQLPNVLQSLSQSEVEGLNVPTIPYTSREIGDFLKDVQDLKASRPFTHRFQNRYRCSKEHLQVQKIAQRLQKGQPFIEMSLVSSGQYSVGGRDDGLGRRPITISRSFFMGMQPVTQKLFHFVYPKQKFAFDSPDAPAECVTWFQALSFCNALSKLDGLQPCYQLASHVAAVRWNREANGYRLPTEAEWEVAAQTGLLHLSTYAVQKHAWCKENADARTHDVAQKIPNQRCIYDLLGNVWEWCWDGYATFEPDKNIDPVGFHNATRRVIRGGSWRTSTAGLGVSIREKESAVEARDDLGFRMVRNAWNTEK